MKLYTIGSEILTALAGIDETGEVTPEVAAALDSLQGDLANKIEQLCKVIRHRKAMAEARSREADRLAALATADKRTAEGLTEHVKHWLEQTRTLAVETPLFKVRVQRNSGPTVTVNIAPELLPEAFQKWTCVANKEMIAELYRMGSEKIPEGVEVTVGSHLRIS